MPLNKSQHIEFEMAVRQLVAGMELPRGVKLYFSHSKSGVTATLGDYESPQIDNQCKAMTQTKSRRCRLEALPGAMYCGHHINKKLEDIDEDDS